MIYFVIPAYNEEKNLKELLENTREFAGAKGYPYQLVIINDGSTDSTMQILKEYQRHLPIIILDQVTNKGVGEAFKRGLGYVAEIAAEKDVIVTKEADNTSDLKILSAMLEKVGQGYDLVLASCYMAGAGIEGTNIYRKILSSGANSLMRLFTPLKEVHTFSSFYRAYTGALLKKAHRVYGDNLIQEKGFCCMVELLLKLSQLGIRICEVPMVLKGNLRKGKSKMKIVKTTMAYVRLIARNILTNGRQTCGRP
jgi:dolichol-phosphate mannosyltransferase